MGTGKEMTATDRTIRKGAIIAGGVVLVLIGWFAFLASSGTNESDAIDACNSRVLGIITEATDGDITKASATKSAIDSNSQYANEWHASGVITSDHMTGVTRPIPFTCTVYMDSTGNELDGSVSIDF